MPEPKWYVMFGKGRMLGTPPAPPKGHTLKPFASEEAAVAFAKKCVTDGFTVTVGELGAEETAKYRTAEIVKLLSADA